MQQQHLPDWTDSEENTPCSLRSCEIDNPDSGEGDLIRKWFTDEYFDLFVWSDNKGEIARFQLCCNKGRDEHALTW
jgi:hypothetical protein